MKIPGQFSTEINIYIHFRFEDDAQSRIIVTADHLFLMPNGKLRSAKNLRKGDEVRQADGGVATIVTTAHGSWSGGVRSLSLGPYAKGDPLDGHLVNSNGIVTADMSVQSVYYQTDLGDLMDEVERAPVGSPRFFAEAETDTYTEFVNNPESWPLNFTPMPQELINIPLSAKGYLTPAQAEDIERNMPEQDLSNSYPIVRTQYVFSIAGAFYDDIVYLIDWNNPVPNAWAFNQSKQSFVVVSGALARLGFMDAAGLSLVVSNLVARHLGAPCTGDADYQGSFDVMRQLWLDDLYIDTLNLGLAEVQQLFDLIDPENRKENPDNICAQPSTECRVEAIMNGSMSRGLPDCAVPPPPFTVEGGHATSETDVVLSFSRPVDPVTARSRANYAFDPEVRVTRARVDVDDQHRINVSVRSLEPGKGYEVKVKDVLDERGQSLSPEHDTAHVKFD